MPDQPLAGYRVLDLTHIFSGPFCTQILGDLGATVIKVERPGGGDPSRGYGVGVGDDLVSGSFLALNRNKRSVAVDMKSEQGRELIQRLVEKSDVLVENFRTGVLARFGLDYETLAEQFPSLVYCSITGFGSAGPLAQRAANDLIVQAYGGLMSMTGEPGRPPVRVGTAVTDFSAGLCAALGVMTALLERVKTGKGQHVEASMLASQTSLMSYFFADYWLRDIVPQPMGTANRLGMPNQVFPAKDGYVAITSANDGMWARCAGALGAPELATDPRFDSLSQRYAHRDELVAEITRLTSAMTSAECVERLDGAGVSCAPVLSLDQIAAEEQMQAAGLITEVDYDGRSHRTIGNPIRLSDTPWTVRTGVPKVGEHSAEIARELDFNEDEIEAMLASGALSAA